MGESLRGRLDGISQKGCVDVVGGYSRLGQVEPEFSELIAHLSQRRKYKGATVEGGNAVLSTTDESDQLMAVAYHTDRYSSLLAVLHGLSDRFVNPCVELQQRL